MSWQASVSTCRARLPNRTDASRRARSALRSSDEADLNISAPFTQCVAAIPGISGSRRTSPKLTSAVMAQSIRGRMALQGLYVPTNADWLSDFSTELLGFPAGKHDDQVDAFGLIGSLNKDARFRAQSNPLIEYPTVRSRADIVVLIVPFGDPNPRL
jgi:hypothetical protein